MQEQKIETDIPAGVTIQSGSILSNSGPVSDLLEKSHSNVSRVVDISSRALERSETGLIPSFLRGFQSKVYALFGADPHTADYYARITDILTESRLASDSVS